MNSQHFAGLCFGLAVAASAVSLHAAESCLVYIGTYTSPHSRGIYVCKLDPATGKCSAPSWPPK